MCSLCHQTNRRFPTDDKNKIAEGFCNYFSNVGQKLAANIPNVGIYPLSYLSK